MAYRLSFRVHAIRLPEPISVRVVWLSSSPRRSRGQQGGSRNNHHHGLRTRPQQVGKWVQEEDLMKCVICKQGETQPGTATVTLERANLTLVIKRVPAQ